MKNDLSSYTVKEHITYLFGLCEGLENQHITHESCVQVRRKENVTVVGIEYLCSAKRNSKAASLLSRDAYDQSNLRKGRGEHKLAEF